MFFGWTECLSVQNYIYGKRKDYALLCQEFGSYWFFLEVKDYYVGSINTNLDFVDEIYVGTTGLATGSDTADESKESELASALQKIVASPQEIGFSNGTRTVTVT